MILDDTISDYEEELIMRFAKENGIDLPEAEKRLKREKKIFFDVTAYEHEPNITYGNIGQEGSLDVLATDIMSYFVQKMPKRMLIQMDNGGDKTHQQAIHEITPSLSKLVNERLTQFNQEHGSDFHLEHIGLKGGYALELRFNYQGNVQDTETKP